MNKEGFKKLCLPVKEDLLAWLHQQLSEYYGLANTVNGGDYLFFSGNCPTMLCAHLDTVHRRQPTKIVDDGNKVSSPMGIGGDDRCGVYAILAILKATEESGKRPYLFFSTDEEVGGASTKRAAQEIKGRVAGVGYMIQIDRRGKQDSVYYKCDNKQFKKFIDEHGFVEAQGSFTDICNLSPVFDLASVNLSCGYYNEHHAEEYVVYAELQDTIDKVVKIIADTKDDIIYPYCEAKPKPTQNYYGNKGSHFWSKFYVKGDEVFTKYGSSAVYKKPNYNSPISGVYLPAYRSFIVLDVKDDFIQIEYNGEKVWSTSWNFQPDYGGY